MIVYVIYIIERKIYVLVGDWGGTRRDIRAREGYMRFLGKEGMLMGWNTPDTGRKGNPPWIEAEVSCSVSWIACLSIKSVYREYSG